jgi:abortive infection Abi-like protein
MPYRLQMLRALMAVHPDRAERLRVHVEALEASIETQPAFCLQNVRTLFEAAHATIAPQLGVQFGKNGGFPDRMRAIIEKLDFTIVDHRDGTKINGTIAALLKGMDDTAVALAQLSNIPNMRHGGSLDWGTLERQHAVMLGGLCDTLVSFLFDVAWSRPAAEPVEPEPTRYDDFEPFNTWLDELHGKLEIGGSVFRPSEVLYLLDATKYEIARREWESEQTAEPAGREAAE